MTTLSSGADASEADASRTDAAPTGAAALDVAEVGTPRAPEPGDTCPRCGSADHGRRYYGPCASCREELGLVMRREARDVAMTGYVPKMNVAPNHVATKE